MDRSWFESLLDRYLEGETTEAENAELEALLREDPGCRRLLVDRGQLEVHLRRKYADSRGELASSAVHGAAGDPAGRKESARKPATRRSAAGRRAPNRSYRLGVLAAAGIFMAVTGILLLSSGRPAPPEGGEGMHVRAAKEEERWRQARGAQDELRQAREQLERQLALAEENQRRLEEFRKLAEDDRKRAELFREEEELREAARQFRARLEEAKRKEGEAAKALPVDPAEKTPAAPEPKRQGTEARPAKTQTVVAKVDTAEGVRLTTGGRRVALRAGEELKAGEGLEAASGGSVVVVFLDKTRLELGPGTEARDFAEGPKRVFVARGSVTAEVAKQPQDQPMMFSTPHGEAKVIGTSLRILVDPDPKKGTRLEVMEGRVELRNFAGKAVMVESGHMAVAAGGVDLSVRSLSLVASWEFEEGGGATANDSSGFENTATLLNGPVWVPGVVKKGLQLSGTKNPYMSVPHSASLDLGAADQSFTVALWYRKATTTPDAGGILVKEVDGVGPTPFSITTSMSGTGRITFAVVGAGNRRAEIVSRRSVADGAWRHIAAVRDRQARVLRLYVDGVENAAPAADSAGEARNTDPIWANRCPVGSTFYHDSFVIDEVRIFNRALSATEVARLVLGKER